MERKLIVIAAVPPAAKSPGSSSGFNPGPDRSQGTGPSGHEVAVREMTLVVVGVLPRSQWVEAANDPQA